MYHRELKEVGTDEGKSPVAMATTEDDDIVSAKWEEPSLEQIEREIEGWPR